MAMKIDISEAYDQVHREYLEEMLLAFGFDQRWVTVLIQCVTTVSYRVRWNGTELGPITPTKD